MKRGKTERETCDINGWGVGTHLVGDEGYGPTVIRITGLGEELLLAKVVSQSGRIQDHCYGESNWTLSCREWVRCDPMGPSVVKVHVNGVEREIHSDLAAVSISYEDMVKLADETGHPSVVYRGPSGGDSRRNGEMHKGCPPLVLESGMSFSVMHTGNA
jgi:hypothetical protein